MHRCDECIVGPSLERFVVDEPMQELVAKFVDQIPLGLTLFIGLVSVKITKDKGSHTYKAGSSARELAAAVLTKPRYLFRARR